MTQLSDCYASLHRSEGFGLTMAHAMAWGKPTIATAYSGNMSFMTRSTSYLVPYKLVEIGTGSAPYPPEALWAEPDLSAAARKMRYVFENRDDAADVGGGRRAYCDDPNIRRCGTFRPRPIAAS